MADLRIEPTPVPGLLVVHLPVHNDNRGWFKENWQRENMTELGLPDFAPVQNNVSYNVLRGATRGIHAEPWDKMVSVATGRIFGAWVDLRAGESFGRVFTLEMGPETAVFVPRGVGNSYQTLEDATSYSYLVNDHWSPEARSSYTFVNLADPSLSISWPIPLEDADVSDADREHPFLEQVVPFQRARPLILGAGGQLGHALRTAFPDADFRTREELDVTDPGALAMVDWRGVDMVVNAAAYTAVDAAETTEGRKLAWQINVHALTRLVCLAHKHGFVLVHVSSDYVFDGTREIHSEDEPFSPLGVYGQTKAAGDALVETAPRHYVVRTSWLVGNGENFVRTMSSLAEQGVSPSVVDDQYGRLTFADDIGRCIRHLVTAGAAYGTYNLTSSGPPRSWADIARAVFELRGRSGTDVTAVTTEQYAEGKDLAPRPRHSTLSLDRIEATGFPLRDGVEALADYLESLPTSTR